MYSFSLTPEDDANEVPVKATVRSLVSCCQREILLDPSVLDLAITSVPSLTHTELLTEAAALVIRFGSRMRHSITTLISNWPKECLNVRDSLPDKQTEFLLETGGGNITLMDMILEGILNIQPQSCLRTVDFCSISASRVFQIPLLSLPREERCADKVLDTLRERCKLVADDEDSMESVLSWQLNEITKKSITGTCHAQGLISILVDCQLNVSDWLTMGEEVIGLVLQDLTPYRIKICKLAIDNYTQKQVTHAQWMFSLIDPKHLVQLMVYGKRSSVSDVLWDLCEQLKALTGLQTLGLGTTYPKIKSVLPRQGGPTEEDIQARTVEVLHTFHRLTELHLIGLILTRKVASWLGAIPGYLQRASMYACHLAREDISYLAQSHHASTLTTLGLEVNDLRPAGEELCEMVRNCPNLELLNVKESQLTLPQKVNILAALQQCPRLHTLAMYEEEDMVSTEGYQTMTELACLVSSLKTFYMFPFNYKPFEIFYRETTEAACTQILALNGRTDLKLFY